MSFFTEICIFFWVYSLFCDMDMAFLVNSDNYYRSDN